MTCLCLHPVAIPFLNAGQTASRSQRADTAQQGAARYTMTDATVGAPCTRRRRRHGGRRRAGVHAHGADAGPEHRLCAAGIQLRRRRRRQIHQRLGACSHVCFRLGITPPRVVRRHEQAFSWARVWSQSALRRPSALLLSNIHAAYHLFSASHFAAAPACLRVPRVIC